MRDASNQKDTAANDERNMKVTTKARSTLNTMPD